MPSAKCKSLPVESLLQLKRRFDVLSPRNAERKEVVRSMANLFGVSEATIYRALRDLSKPKAVTRADSGRPRKMSVAQMERYCELIAALKLRTTNKKGHHISTVRAIELLEKYGVDTPQEHVQVPPGLLTKGTVNRYLTRWGYDHARITRQPAAVRFQAEHSNDCWQFDLSPSDLKQLPEPPTWGLSSAHYSMTSPQESR